MSTIQDLFQQAQLAEAAYADLKGAVGNQSELITRLDVANKDIYNGTFSLAQATAFAAEWTVMDQFTSSGGLLGDGSGFSGTLFRNKAGEYFFSLRGTAGATDLMVDAGDVLTDGIALDQIVDMYNYWQSLTHVGTYQAKQLTTLWAETAALEAAYLISESIGSAYEATLRANPNIIIDNPLHIVRTIQTVDSSQLSNTLLQAGSGKLSGTAVVNVDGHSLGGHLAMAFSRLFPSTTKRVVAVNGAGFNLGNTNVNHLFTMLSGASGFDAGKITNVVGSAAMNLVSQDWLLLQQPAGRQEIYTESWLPGSDTTLGHGSSQMTDSLAIYDLFAKVDPTVSVDTITSIIKAASNQNANTLESALAELGWVYRKVYSTGETSRDDLYTNLYDLQKAIGSNQGKLISLVGQSREQIASLAKTDIAYRHALEKLNPFVVTGNASLYIDHNFDGHLDANRFSDLYLQDRAAMLTWKMQFDSGAKDADDLLSGDKSYDADWDTRSIADDWKFTDMTRNLTLTIDGNGADTHNIVFGSSIADAITGDSKSDHLYGMDGNDTISGGAGDDHLEGGRGNDILQGGAGYDTYVWHAGDGKDQIIDEREADGKVHGIIKIDNGLGQNVVVGGAYVQQGTSEVWVKTLPDGSGSITLTHVGEWTLTLADGSALTLGGFKDGDFGIGLIDGPEVLPDPEITGLTISGDLAAKWFVGYTSDNVPYHYHKWDELGNIITEGSESGREDYLYDSAGNDKLKGLAGNDFLDAYRGGDDIVDGGAGDDEGYGGADNDRLYADQEQEILAGGAGADTIYAGAGDDTIEGDQGFLDTHASWGVTRTVTQGGDSLYTRAYQNAWWYEPGSAEQGDDTIYAGAGADWVFAQGGNDFVDAGIGDDVVFGEGGDDEKLRKAA